MLLRNQLVPIARREGVGLGIAERDYVQHLFLRHAGREPLTFKGGTCLRIAYGSPRYSEDLDFNADSRSVALARLKEGATRLADYGVRAEILERSRRGEGLEARLRFEGPLFDGSPRSRGTVRLEVSLRRESVAVEEVFVPRTPYADVPQLVLRVLTKEHLFAEKVRALLVRGQPRDLYDLHFLLERGFDASRDLLDEKMALYGRRFTFVAMDQGIASARRSWAQDLGPLLGQVPPIRPVSEAVRTGLRRIVAGVP